MFANCQMGGQDSGFPDVCLTPAPPAPAPVPIPYPNIAIGPMAVGFVPNILISAMPAHNMSTSIPMTNGDNVGVSTGVASGTVMGPSRHLTGSFNLIGLERDGADHGMPATTVSFTDFGDVVCARPRRPWI